MHDIWSGERMGILSRIRARKMYFLKNYSQLRLFSFFRAPFLLVLLFTLCCASSGRWVWWSTLQIVLRQKDDPVASLPPFPFIQADKSSQRRAGRQEENFHSQAIGSTDLRARWLKWYFNPAGELQPSTHPPLSPLIPRMIDTNRNALRRSP